MLVPFVLISESGKTVPVIWEENGTKATPNLQRV